MNGKGVKCDGSHWGNQFDIINITFLETCRSGEYNAVAPMKKTYSIFPLNSFSYVPPEKMLFKMRVWHH